MEKDVIQILRIRDLKEDLDALVIEYDGINLNTNKLETHRIDIDINSLYQNLPNIIRYCIKIRKDWDKYFLKDLKKTIAKL